MSNKLDGFEATTAVELMLYNEIKNLNKQLYIMSMERGIYPQAVIAEPMQLNVNHVDTPYLKLAPNARVRGSIGINGHIEIRSEVKFRDNPGAFGSIMYTDDIYKNKFEATHSLSHLHKRFIETLARELAK